MKLPKLGETLGKVFGRGRKEAGESASGGEEKSVVPVGAPAEKVYLKALPLRDLEDVEMIKQEVKLGNVLILKVSPLAKKSIDDVKMAVSQLMEFTQSVGGDIARLGEERVVITPSFIRIWREKTATAGGALPTAA
ncbi:MAG TPA: cell division protein SepF [Candidatus Bathyarchaeia archaeon]|nr:cell division protein SepF [Candidatus Bathyarchaeia archaeon]